MDEHLISISPACYIIKNDSKIPAGKCNFNLIDNGNRLPMASLTKITLSNCIYANIPFMVNLPARVGMHLNFKLWKDEIIQIRVEHVEPINKTCLIHSSTIILDITPNNLFDNAIKSNLMIIPKEIEIVKTSNDLLFNSLVKIIKIHSMKEEMKDEMETNSSNEDTFSKNKRGKGILIVGPSGIGKSHTVLSFLEKTNIPQEYISAQSLHSEILERTEENIKRIFWKITEKSRASPEYNKLGILCIDDLEVIGSTPKNSTDWKIIQVFLNCILEVMENRDNILIFGITNKPESIWKNLLNPDFFYREFKVGIPNHEERMVFLKEFCKGFSFEKDSFDLEVISKKAVGYLVKDLQRLVKVAIINSIERSEKKETIKSGDNLSDALGRLTISINSSIAREHGPILSLLDFDDAFRSVQPSIFKDYYVSIDPKVTWESIGGLDEIRNKIRKLIEWPLTRIEEYKYFGLRAPRGILLHGPPGCSKTTIAKAIANSGGFAFFAIDSASLFSAYVGESERILRQIFSDARAAQPSVIFFDEIETLVGKRGASNGDVVQERVLSTMLNEMDGVGVKSSSFSSSIPSNQDSLVIVIGATNRPQDIDEALLRPGRFDYKIEIPLPDSSARFQIFKLYSEKVPISPLIDFKSYAIKVEGFSGADIKGLFDAAGLIAISRGSDIIENNDFASALNNSYRWRKNVLVGTLP